MTIQSWLESAQTKLSSADIQSAHLDSSLLLAHCLSKKREWLLAHNHTTLSADEIKKLNKTLDQRLGHTPLAYIIGSKEFYGRNFKVTKDVLIPRPESEVIIELLAELDTGDSGLKTIHDVGTGSGCLAITAKLELPDTTVVATDISKPALKVAHQNASQLGASVQFYEANLLDIPSAIHADIILANLPYVPDDLVTSEEIAKEPAGALFSGSDGLNHYRIFWQQIINLPHQPNHVITESLASQHPALRALAKTAGYKVQKTSTLAQHFTRIK